MLTGNFPEPISCCMLATFGGSLADIPPITLVYYPPGDYWGFGGSIGSPVVTPCGIITILEFISGGPAGFQLSLALNTFTSIATGYHTAGCPRSTDPGTYFIWESGDQVADAGSCAGTFTVTITETSCDGGGDSGSTGDYRIGVDTLLTKDGERIFTAVNCAASGPAAYRIGRDTGLTKAGKRIFAAELDPCCDGGLPIIPDCAASIALPRHLTLTILGSIYPGEGGPYTLTYIGGIAEGFAGSSWQISGMAGPGCVIPGDSTLTFQCVINRFRILLQWPFNLYEPTRTVNNLTPFHQEFTLSGFPSGPNFCGDPLTFVVTE